MAMLGEATFVAFIPVRSLDSAREFYCGTLGLTVVDQTPVAVVVNAGGASLRLTEVPELRPQGFTVAGWLVSDISSTIASLAKAGVPMTRYEGMVQDDQGVWTAPSGDRVAWFADPDGNVLSITSRPSSPEFAPSIERSTPRP
jgi:catechol 2,3-dioxygenase-like lactoylglutathione lyase family enzyme